LPIANKSLPTATYAYDEHGLQIKDNKIEQDQQHFGVLRHRYIYKPIRSSINGKDMWLIPMVPNG